MSPVLKKGWCPTLLAPMESGDGWLVRVKPVAARLDASAARIVAEVASLHGNGEIDLTARANLQIRGLSAASAERAAERLLAAGLASTDPAVEAIRNVMASPLGPDDATADFDSHSVARAIEAMLAEEPSFAVLPPKFSILVDGGGLLPLADITADITIRASWGRFAVMLDGGRFAAFIPEAEIAKAVRSLLLAFLALTAGKSAATRRMRALAMAVGEEAIFRAAGLLPLPLPPSARQAPAALGFIPHRGEERGAYGIGLPFGRIDADSLGRIADVAARFGDGSLRTTPWRALVLPNVFKSDAALLDAEVEGLGLIADNRDPRRSTFACVGAPACPNASVETRRDAARLAAALGSTGITVHFSGCAKACAHRGAAALTLVGREGRYDLIRNGCATDRPSLTGLTIDQAVALVAAAAGQRP